ncbi:MAG: hypothetical protein E6772_16905 [Dysgonomonas sp.]|nr:hypothetical protein [Dysgonomonas sp.]
MTNSPYTITDFCIFLKLGIFKRGEIEHWGNISLASEALLRKPLTEYNRRLYISQLNKGVCLLDFYLQYKISESKNIYILVLSVSDHLMRDRDHSYVFQLVTGNKIDDIKAFIAGVKEHTKKRKSIFRKKRKKSTFDFMPINAIPRKY